MHEFWRDIYEPMRCIREHTSTRETSLQSTLRNNKELCVCIAIKYGDLNVQLQLKQCLAKYSETFLIQISCNVYCIFSIIRSFHKVYSFMLSILVSKNNDIENNDF